MLTVTEIIHFHNHDFDADKYNAAIKKYTGVDTNNCFIIICPTYLEGQFLFNIFKQLGVTWFSHRSCDPSFTRWDNYETESCYILQYSSDTIAPYMITYCDLNHLNTILTTPYIAGRNGRNTVVTAQAFITNPGLL